MSMSDSLVLWACHGKDSWTTGFAEVMTIECVAGEMPGLETLASDADELAGGKHSAATAHMIHQ